MEVFGGFMAMVSILGFFLTVIWFVMPFVVFAIKGKVDRAEDQLASIEVRLAALEKKVDQLLDATIQASTTFIPTAAEPDHAPSDGV